MRARALRTWRQLRRDRRSALGAAVSALVAALGIFLLVGGGSAGVRRAHPQPLPARPFVIAPSQARGLPEPVALTRPPTSAAGTSCAAQDIRPLVAIPALCVYAPIVTTTVDQFGSLVIPDDVHLVGLDSDSAPLTATHGTTIIAGHVDDRQQGDGAFYPLYRTAPGTPIEVTTADGHRSTWRVFRVISVAKDHLPADMFDTRGKRQLVLVTCGGSLSYEPGYGYTYSDNVLVYATPA